MGGDYSRDVRNLPSIVLLAFQSDVACILRKPVALDDLVAAVERCLRESR
jgi:hypothetical protein